MSNFFAGFLAKGSGSGSFVEINYAGYARQAVTFGPMANGQVANLDPITFTAAAPWLPVTQDGLYDAAGNPFLWWPTAASLTVGAGQSINIRPGGIQLYFDAFAVTPTASLQYAAGAAVGIKPGGLAVTALAAVQIANGVLSIPATNLLAAANLPTTLPGAAGVLWLNGGLLSVS